jgi:hypothetical protein
LDSRPDLLAIPGHCAERGCENVFFFGHGGSTYLGKDNKSPVFGVRVWWSLGDQVALVYPRFASGDATCCPSLDPNLVIFSLRSARLVRRDP